MESLIGGSRESAGGSFVEQGQVSSPAAEPSHAQNVREAREFLRRLSIESWQNAAPDAATMTGQDYRDVWLKLSGEGD